MKPVGIGLLLIAAGLCVPARAGAQSPAWGAGAGLTFVYTADGAGDATSLSENLPEALSGLRLPLRPQPIPWCRYGTVLLDYQDTQAQLAAAAELAGRAQAVRYAYPGCRVVFLGHSAGTYVVLAAAAAMPPGSVDRIVLLSSSLSFCYDLSGALRASCGGIDNFYSPYDGILDLTPTLGTTDRIPTVSAGAVGFRRPPAGDVALYQNLRQYRWNESLRGQGGHLVWTHPAMLRAYIVPLLLSPAPVVTPAR